MEEVINKIKKYWVPVFWGFFAIGASAGAFNAGGGFYVVAGIANILINGFAIYKYTKQIQEHEEK